MKKSLTVANLFVTIFISTLFYIAIHSYLQQKNFTFAKAITQPMQYARILDNCYLYTEAKENTGMFILPKTYYVKVHAKEDLFYKVSYLDDSDFATPVYGYVLQNKVTIINNYIPQNPYLQCKVPFTFTLNTIKSMQNLLTEITLELPFYGISQVNTNEYYCFNYDNAIWAIEQKYVPRFDYPLHPDSLNFVTNTNGTNITTTKTSNFVPLITTISIGLLCIFGLSIGYFIFHANKKTKPIQVFDEMDDI